ncbi:hypothetical protein BGZ83_006245 [Gryganskiella cystojenkinii]|nr:hypothetical protein BGZ83_006245 [Gryganskiella cystojenkinii]
MDLSANPTEAKTSHGTNNEISDLLSVSSIPTCDPSFDAQPRILLGHIISATAAPLQKLRGDNDSDEDDSDSKYNGSSLRVTTAATTIAEAITTARPTTKDDADNVGEPSCASLTATSSAPVVVPFAHIESEKTLRDEPFDEGEEILADIPIAAVTTTAAAAAATTRTTAMETTEGAKREQPLSTGTSTGDRKRMSGSSALDQTLSRKKRGKNQELNCGGTLIYKMSASPKMVPPILQQEHPQHHANLLRRQDLENELSSSTTLPFDPILFFSMWSPSSSSNDSDKAPKIDRNPANTGTHRYYCSGHPQRSRHHQHCYHLYRNKGDRNLYTSTPSSLEAPQSRKRVFSEAITLSRPLKQELKFVDYHPDWVESIKKRKIHQYATRWTSLLSPSPYVKVLTLRDFWDLMETRTDLSWLAEKDMDTDLVGKGTATEDFSQDSSKARTARTSGLVIGRRQSDSAKQKKAKQTVHYPCPSQFLKGLWEEEMMIMRKRQMIPDNVRKPNRSKVFNPRPISLARKSLKATNSPALAFSLTPGIESPKPEFDTEVGDQTGHEPKETTAAMTVQGPGEFEFSLKKKHRAAAIIRSHAITEGSDMAEYKPWKDGTTSPQKGSLQSLKELRCHIMDPWPAEISKARDECTRVLHRMREQLNIVINLQIHLRSMIKTAPTHWSFLLSIRHPGQVSIELLLALYGPNFMNTSNFKAIEQLLWGSHKGAGGSASSLLSSPSSSTTTSTTTSSSTPPPFATETVDQSSPMDTTSIV